MNIKEQIQGEMSHFCENVKKLRKRRGISVKELSELSGVSEYMITNFEKGIITKGSNVEHLLKLCDYFGMKTEMFSPLSENTE